jgi:hypothetical protein
LITHIARTLRQNIESIVRDGNEVLLDEDDEAKDADEWHRISLKLAYDHSLREVSDMFHATTHRIGAAPTSRASPRTDHSMANQASLLACL